MPWLPPLLVIAGTAVVLAVLNLALRSRRPRVDEEHWVAGMFYVNRADRRLLVPKRFGLGRTLNLAHPLVWLLLAVPVAVAVLLSAQRAH